MSIIQIKRTQTNVRDEYFSIGEMLELFTRLAEEFGPDRELLFAYVDDECKQDYHALEGEALDADDGDVVILLS